MGGPVAEKGSAARRRRRAVAEMRVVPRVRMLGAPPGTLDAHAPAPDALPVSDIPYHFSGRDGEVLVVGLPAELTHQCAEILRRTVEGHLPNRAGAAAVLDMSGVSIISSIGIAALLQVSEYCGDQRARLVVASLPQRLRQFLAMLKLEEKFEYAPDLDAALALLAQ